MKCVLKGVCLCRKGELLSSQALEEGLLLLQCGTQQTCVSGWCC